MDKRIKKVFISTLIIIVFVSAFLVSSKIVSQKENDEIRIMRELIETQQVISKNILKTPEEVGGAISTERFDMINFEWLTDNHEYIGDYLVKLDIYLKEISQVSNPSEEQIAFVKIINNTSAETRFFYIHVETEINDLKQLYVEWCDSITFEKVDEYEKRIFEKITLG